MSRAVMVVGIALGTGARETVSEIVAAGVSSVDELIVVASPGCWAFPVQLRHAW